MPIYRVFLYAGVYCSLYAVGMCDAYIPCVLIIMRVYTVVYIQ